MREGQRGKFIGNENYDGDLMRIIYSYRVN